MTLSLRNLSGALVAFAALSSCPLPSYAADTMWFVDKGSGSDDNNGSAWANSFKTLKKALDEAKDGDVIWMAAGVYGGLDDNNTKANAADESATSTFTITQKNLSIYGGFFGDEDFNSSAFIEFLDRDHGGLKPISDTLPHIQYAGHPVNETSILGSAGFRAIYAKGSNLRLDGITVEGGDVVGDGGGICVESGIKLWRCKVTGNEATGNGGGVMAKSGNLDLIWTQITENRSSYGSGMYISPAAKGTIINSRFEKNDAGNESSLFSTSTTLTIFGSVFFKNTGTAAALTAQESEIKFSTFAKNGPNFVSGVSGLKFKDTILDGTINPLFVDDDEFVTENFNNFKSPAWATSGDLDVDANQTSKKGNLLTDFFDLDGDKDFAETVPLDIEGYVRHSGGYDDLPPSAGAYEWKDTELIAYEVGWVPEASDPVLSVEFQQDFDDGKVASGPFSFLYQQNTDVDLTVNPVDSHWQFKEWKLPQPNWVEYGKDRTGGDAPNMAKYFVAGTGIILTAVFEQKPYSISLVGNPGKRVDGLGSSITWRYKSDGTREDTTASANPDEGGEILLDGASYSQPADGFHYPVDDLVEFEAVATDAYDLFGWVVDSNGSDEDAKDAAAQLLLEVNGTGDSEDALNTLLESLDIGSTSNFFLNESNASRFNILRLRYNANHRVIPIFMEKKFDVTVAWSDAAGNQLVDNLGEDDNTTYARKNPLESEPEFLRKDQLVDFTLPENNELIKVQIAQYVVYPESLATDPYIQPFGFTWDGTTEDGQFVEKPDGEKGFEVILDEERGTGTVRFEIKPKMQGKVKVQLYFGPISKVVTAVYGKSKGVDINATEMMPPRVLENTGLEIAPNVFTQNSTVILEWKFKDIKDEGKFVGEWVYELDGVLHRSRHNPHHLTMLTQDIEAELELKLREVTFTHKIYLGDRTDPNTSYLLEKSTHFADSKVFVPYFPEKTGYEIRQTDSNETNLNATSSIIEVFDGDQSLVPGDEAYAYFVIDRNTTIVTEYLPKTYSFSGNALTINAFNETAPGGGEVVGWPTLHDVEGDYKFGDKVSAYAQTEAGYEFLYWQDADFNTTNPRIFAIADDVNATAVFRITPREVTFRTLGGDGDVSYSEYASFVIDNIQAEPKKHLDTIKKDYNSAIRIKVIARPGFSFGEDLLVRIDQVDSSVLVSFPRDSIDSSQPIIADLNVTGDLTVTAEVVRDLLQDSDGDGLSNYLESLYGTDAYDRDYDKDFLPDWWEVVDWRKIMENKVKYDQDFWLNVRSSQGWLIQDPNRMSLPSDHNDSVLYSPTAPPPDHLHLDPRDNRDGDPDKDEDNKPDKGGLATDPFDDPDFDGLSNLYEYLSGTNPLDPDTFGTGSVDQYSPIDVNSSIILDANITEVSFVFKIADSEANGTAKTPDNWIDFNGSVRPGTIFPPPNAQGLYPMSSGNSFLLKVTSEEPGYVFDSWTFNGNDFSGDEVSYVPLGDADEIFVRFRLDDNDTDGDGLTNYQELFPAMGIPVTNPDNNDTDGDSILDKLEIDYGLNPDDNSTELPLLSLIKTNPADFGIVATESGTVATGSGSPSGGTSDLNATKQDLQLDPAMYGAKLIDQADFRESQAYYELLKGVYYVPADEEKVTIYPKNERVDLYRFIASPATPDQIVSIDLGWFYTEQHGWAWLHPDYSGYIYLHKGSEGVPGISGNYNWLNLNPPQVYHNLQKDFEGGYPFNFGQFFSFPINEGNIIFKGYPSILSGGQTDSGAGSGAGSAGGSSQGGQESGTGGVDDLKNFFKN